MVGVLPLLPKKDVVAKEETAQKGTDYIKDLPKRGFAEAIVLTVEVTAHETSGTSGVTYVEDAPYKLLKRVRIEAAGGKVILDATGQDLKYLNLYNYGRVVEEGALPTDAGASGTIRYTLRIPIALDDSEDVEQLIGTLLPAYKLAGWQIKISLGQESDIVASGSLSIDSIKITITYEYYDETELENPDEVAANVFVVKRILYEQDVVSTGEKELKLDTGVYRRLILRAVNGGTLSDDLVREVSVVADGDTVYRTIWKSEKQNDVVEYGLQAVPAGIISVDFGTFDLSQSIEAENEMDVKYEVVATPTAPAKFAVLAEELVEIEKFLS